jgi:hypothetical protein
MQLLTISLPLWSDVGFYGMMRALGLYGISQGASKLALVCVGVTTGLALVIGWKVVSRRRPTSSSVRHLTTDKNKNEPSLLPGLGDDGDDSQETKSLINLLYAIAEEQARKGKRERERFEVTSSRFIKGLVQRGSFIVASPATTARQVQYGAFDTNAPIVSILIYAKSVKRTKFI